MKHFAFVVACTLIISSPAAAAITSPDGKLAVDVSVVEGALRFSVTLDGQPILKSSPLGLVTSQGDFSSGLRIVDQSPTTLVDSEYELAIGKRRRIRYQANRAVVTVANDSGKRLSVVFQVSDDGVALAYQLHGETGEKVKVERELTGFALPAGARSFLHPMDVAKEGWSRTFPSYEAHYKIDRPVGEASPTGQGWCFPALFKVGDDGWVLVSETGVDGRYCGSHLAHDSTGGVYTIAPPQAAEHSESAPVEPKVAGSAQLPWRIMIVGRSLAPIVASTLATDVVEPKFEAPPSLPPPGRAAWSWLPLKDGQTTYDVQRRFIDMAAELKFEYVLIDSMWDRQIGREKIAELVEYARGKDVGVLLWYNSNGSWNDAPQTPQDGMHTPEARAKEMGWMRDIGVKGIKVDFFGGDKQAVMQLYEDILTDAARYGLAVNFHGATLPRGWERMFPNLVTTEAVMGMEFCTFEQRHADQEAQHATVIPFTRNVVAPADFTPTMLVRRLGPDGRGPRRRTTDAFELALPVILFSGIQHFGLTPEQVAAQPEFVREYLRQVPTTWDETRLVDGYPGRFAVLARRKGPQWYVAAINGEGEAKTLKLDVSFARDGPWTMIADGDERGVKQDVVTPVADGAVDLTLQPNGGAVLWRDSE